MAFLLISMAFLVGMGTQVYRPSQTTKFHIAARAPTPTMGEWRRRSSASRRAEEERRAAAAQAVREGDALMPGESEAIEAVGGPSAATYGEITAKGFASLAARLRLDSTSHFADLGSGTGKVVLQSVQRNDVAYACGVELSPSRHAVAVAVLEHCAPHLVARVRLVNGDVADSTLWSEGGALSAVTDVYLSSLLFSPELLLRIAAALEGSQVQQVATLRRFPSGLTGFVEEAHPEPCEMSWTMGLVLAGSGDEAWAHPGQDVYLYQRECTSGTRSL